MSLLSGTELAILAVAAYVSITALVRLMHDRRDEMVVDYQARIAREQRRKQAEQRNERQRRAREQQINLYKAAVESREEAS